MSTRKHKPAGARKPQRPMTADLAGYATSDAIAVARSMLDEPDFYPGAVEAANAALDHIQDWTRRNSLDRISDVTGEAAERLLLETTGADSLHSLDPETSDALHLHRNTLSLVRLAVLLCRPSALTRRSDRPAKDSIDAGLPEIGPRTGYRLRALRNDEIILTRMLTALDLTEQAPLVPVHNYVLSEAGLAPMEITDAQVSKLTWDEQALTGITAKGVHGRGPRRLLFDSWQRGLLSTTLPLYQRSGRPYLAYTGSAPGSQAACASTSPTLKRFLRRAGVTGADISPGSVTLWRPDHVLQQQHDLAAAAGIAGSTPELLLKNLHYTVEEISLHRGIATLVTLDTRPDVRVPAGQVRGLGSFMDDENNPGTLRPAA